MRIWSRSTNDGVEPVNDGVEPVNDGVEPVNDGVEPVNDGVERTAEIWHAFSSQLHVLLSIL